jgi:hypothetical protein
MTVKKPSMWAESMRSNGTKRERNSHRMCSGATSRVANVSCGHIRELRTRVTRAVLLTSPSSGAHRSSSLGATVEGRRRSARHAERVRTRPTSCSGWPQAARSTMPAAFMLISAVASLLRAQDASGRSVRRSSCGSCASSPRHRNRIVAAENQTQAEQVEQKYADHAVDRSSCAAR